MELKIEKGIPIPERRESKTIGITSTLRQMEVGDSLLVSTWTKQWDGATLFQRLRVHNMRFVRSQVEGGIRVWRVE